MISRLVLDQIVPSLAKTLGTRQSGVTLPKRQPIGREYYLSFAAAIFAARSRLLPPLKFLLP
jgi:hypothetical protein